MRCESSEFVLTLEVLDTVPAPLRKQVWMANWCESWAYLKPKRHSTGGGAIPTILQSIMPLLPQAGVDLATAGIKGV